MKKSKSHFVNSALAAVIFYYALELSDGSRTAIDYSVIGLLGLAISYNLIQCARRLHSLGGWKNVGHLARTLLYWFVGIFNTLLLNPELQNTFRPWLGGVFIVAALLGSVEVAKRERGNVEIG